MSARPAQTVLLSLQPSLSMNHNPRQWITARADTLATHTFGRRDVFATVDQTTLALATRLDWTFTPTLSLQLYARPFVSTAEFSDYKELAAPRTAELRVYGRDAGTIERAGERSIRLDPEGDGPAAPFTFGQAFGHGDFHLRSLRGVLDAPARNVFVVKATYWLAR